MPDLDGDTLSERAIKFGLVPQERFTQLQEAGEWEPDGTKLMRLLERKGLLTPFQSEKLLKGDTTGFTIGGYRLLYKIASGTFGRVYRATDPESGMVVAVKVLRQSWSEKPMGVELFEREGRVGLTLRHPNIVEILAVNRDRITKQHFMIMEFVEGGNLRDFISVRKKLPASVALRLTAEAAAGLAHAHANNVAHRDIKPTNMLISSQGALKLVDFGLACLYEAGGTNVRAEEKLRPTVDYAGLEKVTAVQSGDPRSDIYFLGCVVYQMLAGRPALDMTKDKNARQARQRFDAVKPLTAADVEGPHSLIQLVERMMSLDPLARYQTTQALVEAIGDVRRELEGAAAAGGGPTGPPKTVFILEPHEKLQDAIRTKLKERGFRVLLSADPARALARFQEQPYDALVVDAGSTGEPGLNAFRSILNEAEHRRHRCAGVLLLSEEQADWSQRVGAQPRMAALVRPVSMRQLTTALDELLRK